MQSNQIDIRRIATDIDHVFHEGGPRTDEPLIRGAIAAVIKNPFAGRYVEEISPLMEDLKPLGVSLAEQLLATMSVGAEQIESYGKGAIIGSDGELEHGALWHVPGGYAMRELLGFEDDVSARNGGKGNALAIVPSTKKVGAVGTALDVPLTHINASYVRSHFDAIEVRVPDAPRADELVVILAMATGARIHARVGGLRADAISAWNGLR
ncbi:amino acid synthesis family protein [Streptomyces sp. NBC_00144]|uniref:amino acid synthesis family protein n=1 Tax=Streptomyces sp. NBC_00144 TaxID=2975665 RepID=UPI003247CF6C